MPRELRVSITVPLPDGDIFAEAAIIAAAHAPIVALRDALPSGAVVTAEVVTPKPRGARDETDQAPEPGARGASVAVGRQRVISGVKGAFAADQAAD